MFFIERKREREREREREILSIRGEEMEFESLCLNCNVSTVPARDPLRN